MIGLVIGVDAGGSRTRVAVADANGETIATSEREGGAVKPGEIERSASIIAAAVRDALITLDPTLGAPRALCAGVAGVGRESERRALSEALLNESLADDVLVMTDAEIAMADAFGDEAGIVLIAGTGSIAHGRGPTGILERVGGWGPNIGDEGGGFWIARRALSIVTAATDGREPETSLVGAILTAAELDQVESLISWASTATVSQMASLAPVVVASAEAGDLRANALLGLAAEELVLHLRTLARSLFEDERAAVHIALGGGLLEPGSALRRRVEHRLKSAVPGGKVHAAPIVAVRGAVRRALQIGAEIAPSEERAALP
jgi:glucosamine kinase